MWFSVVAYLAWLEGFRFVEGLERIEVSWCQNHSLSICLAGESGLVSLGLGDQCWFFEDGSYQSDLCFGQLMCVSGPTHILGEVLQIDGWHSSDCFEKER